MLKNDEDQMLGKGEANETLFRQSSVFRLLRNQGGTRLWDCGEERYWVIRDRRLPLATTGAEVTLAK